MPKVSLTDLIDLVSKVALQKKTKLRQVKFRGDYGVASDYYKGFRDRLISHHKANGPRSGLATAIGTPTDPKKIDGYLKTVAGYAKWWGRQQLTYFAPPASMYESNGVAVSVNPELGLEVNGHPHVIKLYLRGESELSKSGSSVICSLMEATLRAQVPASTTMSVLDVRRSKLFHASSSPQDVMDLVDSELAWIAVMWERL